MTNNELSDFLCADERKWRGMQPTAKDLELANKPISEVVDDIKLRSEYAVFLNNKNNPPLSFETWKREREGK